MLVGGGDGVTQGPPVNGLIHSVAVGGGVFEDVGVALGMITVQVEVGVLVGVGVGVGDGVPVSSTKVAVSVGVLSGVELPLGVGVGKSGSLRHSRGSSLGAAPHKAIQLLSTAAIWSAGKKSEA